MIVQGCLVAVPAAKAFRVLIRPRAVTLSRPLVGSSLKQQSPARKTDAVDQAAHSISDDNPRITQVQTNDPCAAAHRHGHY